MSGWTLEAWVNLAAAAVAIVAGVGGVPVLVQRLKTALGWSGSRALWLTIGVSIAFAFLTEMARGTINAESFSPVNVGALLSLVVSSSQVIYQRIKAQESASG